MKSIPLSNVTRRLSPPLDWDHTKDGLCHTLEISDVDGYMISGWELTEPEKKRLIAGAPLFLAIRGKVHPVISLWVKSEKEKV